MSFFVFSWDGIKRLQHKSDSKIQKRPQALPLQYFFYKENALILKQRQYWPQGIIGLERLNLFEKFDRLTIKLMSYAGLISGPAWTSTSMYFGK